MKSKWKNKFYHMLLSIAPLLVLTPSQWLNYQWTTTCRCFLPVPFPRHVWVWLCQNSGKSVQLMRRKGKLWRRQKCLKPEGPDSIWSLTQVPGKCRWLTGGLWDAACRKFTLVLFGNQAFALTLVPSYKIDTREVLVQMALVARPYFHHWMT